MRVLVVLVCILAVVACSSGESGDTTAALKPSTTERTTTTASTTTSPPTDGFEVTTEDRTLLGGDENLFVRIWSPKDDGKTTRKLIVLAHGLNGEPDKFDDLSSTWAKAGYVVAAPRFPESSTTGGASVAGFTKQPAEVTSVIDQLTADRKLRLDADHVAVAGLSLGGSTIYALTTDPCCMDTRIQGAAIFDGVRPGPFGKAALVPNEVPVVIMHCDHDPVLPYADHAVPGFARMTAPAWLITMPCAEHPQPYEDEPSDFDHLVEQVTVDLWSSVLRDDPEAAARIATDVQTDGRAKVETKSS